MIKRSKKLAEELCEKISREHDAFIDEMKKQSPEYIIKTAYEIVWKQNITDFVENERLYLSREQYNALLSVPNALDELYVEWFTSGELNTYNDIELLLEDTADAIIISIKNQETGEP